MSENNTPKNTFVIQNVNPPVLNKLIGELTANGTTTTKAPVIAGSDVETYSIKGHGVEAIASHNTKTNELSVTVNKKPFFVTVDHVETGLEEALNKASLPAA